MKRQRLNEREAHAGNRMGRACKVRKEGKPMLQTTNETGSGLDEQRDPIMALIYAHKRAYIDFAEAVELYGDTDKPAEQRLYDNVSDAEERAAMALVAMPPTTLPGVIAILQYAH